MNVTITAEEIGRNFLTESKVQFIRYVGLVHHAVGQLDEDQLWRRSGERSNSVANLLIHLAGNFTQRIGTHLLGGPDDRDRLAEFADRSQLPRSELLTRFNSAAEFVESTLSSFPPEQLLRVCKFSNLSGPQDKTALGVILDMLIHFNGHAQEIVHMTRDMLGDRYRFQYPDGVPMAMRPPA